VVRYGEIEARIDRVAALLSAAGMRAGDRLAISIGNRFEFVGVMHGAMRAGVVPVPQNTRPGAEVLGYILRDADCRAVVIDPAANPQMEGVVAAAGLGLRFALDRAPDGFQDCGAR